MRKLLGAATAMVLLAQACFGGGSAGRSVLVDFSHDEFASTFIRFFPSRLAVRQGDELVFKQTWTGEPHTVTGGTLADRVGRLVRPFLEKLRKGEPLPDEPPPAIDKAMNAVGWAFAEEDKLNQTMAQPCYLRSGQARKDGKPCRTQSQPLFDGKQSLYNSGIIPYEGPRGNEFRVRLSPDIKPGTYFFYCVVHGPFQSTDVEVRPRDGDIPSPEEAGRRATSEIEEMAAPLQRIFRDAREDGIVTIGGRKIEGPFAGLGTPEVEDAAINEFIPRRLRAKVGEKVTWKVFGGHTITFDVPRYFPIVEFRRDGTVRFNPRLHPPAGGAPKVPEQEGKGILRVDGGAYDGEGFWSSGLIGSEPYLEYSLRFSKPGRYKYACLVHPPMVGTVAVTS